MRMSARSAIYAMALYKSRHRGMHRGMESMVTMSFDERETVVLLSAVEYALKAARAQATEPRHHEDVHRLQALRDKLWLECNAQVKGDGQ